MIVMGLPLFLAYSELLTTSATYRPSGKNTKYDLVIATSRIFQRFRRLAGNLKRMIRCAFMALASLVK
jgi:hypothetical protein